MERISKRYELEQGFPTWSTCAPGAHLPI